MNSNGTGYHSLAPRNHAAVDYTTELTGNMVVDFDIDVPSQKWLRRDGTSHVLGMLSTVIMPASAHGWVHLPFHFVGLHKGWCVGQPKSNVPVSD